MANLSRVSNTIEKPKPLSSEEQKLIAEAQNTSARILSGSSRLPCGTCRSLKQSKNAKTPLKNAVQFGNDFRVRFLKRTEAMPGRIRLLPPGNYAEGARSRPRQSIGLPLLRYISERCPRPIRWGHDGRANNERLIDQLAAI